MTSSPSLLHLTWAGLDAAVDVIAACCTRRDRSGVHGEGAAGTVLAVALAERLGLNLLPLPTPGMLMVAGLVRGDELHKAAVGCDDVEAWAWIDASGEQRCSSVMRVDGAVEVVFPWQDAPHCCRRPFVTGFDD